MDNHIHTRGPTVQINKLTILNSIINQFQLYGFNTVLPSVIPDHGTTLASGRMACPTDTYISCISKILLTSGQGTLMKYKTEEGLE